MSKTKREVFDSIPDEQWKVVPRETAFNWECLLYNLLVKIDPPKEIKKGLIVLTEDTNRRENMGRETGTILDLGDCCFQGYKTKSSLKVGDRVVFQKYSGMFADPSDVTLRVMRDNDIVARDHNKIED